MNCIQQQILRSIAMSLVLSSCTGSNVEKIAAANHTMLENIRDGSIVTIDPYTEKLFEPVGPVYYVCGSALVDSHVIDAVAGIHRVPQHERFFIVVNYASLKGFGVFDGTSDPEMRTSFQQGWDRNCPQYFVGVLTPQSVPVSIPSLVAKVPARNAAQPTLNMALNDEQRMALYDAVGDAQAKTMAAKLAEDCALMGCKPKAEFTGLALAKNMNAWRTVVASAVNKAIAAAQGRPAMIAALRDVLTKTTDYIDNVAPKLDEGKTKRDARLEALERELDDARARVQTEIDLAQ